MSKKAFEEKVREIEQLRSGGGGGEAKELLSKALKNRSNYLVSKAASVAGDLQLGDLIPDLVAAFEQFLKDAEKTDPQCWAKIAAAKALKDLGHRDPDVFLRGLAHVQMEPVWGGRQDTAGPLRSTCALALVDCQLDDFEVLSYLADTLTDAEAPVRADAALAIAQLGRPEGALLLRLKARVGDQEPGVTGQCLASLLNLAGAHAVGFAAKFLDHADPEVRVEAAAALGASREPEAVNILVERYGREREFELRRAIVTSLGASPIPAAAEFLLSVIAKGETDLPLAAVAALAASRFRKEFREKVERAVATRGEANLRKVFGEEFGTE